MARIKARLTEGGKRPRKALMKGLKTRPHKQAIKNADGVEGVNKKRKRSKAFASRVNVRKQMRAFVSGQSEFTFAGIARLVRNHAGEMRLTPSVIQLIRVVVGRMSKNLGDQLSSELHSRSSITVSSKLLQTAANQMQKNGKNGLLA